VVTVTEAIESSEIWKNTTRGICALKVLDNLGRENDKVIRGGQTFQISTRERQMNQWGAATGDLDMFRNGRFALISPAAATDMSEIQSPDSWTDKEIEDFVLQRIGDEKVGEDAKEAMVKVVAEMNSQVTLIRFKEEAALQKLPAKLRKVIDNRLDEVTEDDVAVVEREIIDDREIVKTKGEKPKGG
jgi:hypothetical protein